MAINSEINVIVMDCESHSVLIVMQFGGVKHEKPKFRFQKPRGVAVDGKGQVFVSDSDNKRVLMFR